MEYIVALVAGIVTATVYALTRQQQQKAYRRKQPHPALDTQNTTNYNMEILEEEPLKELSHQDAQRMVDHWKRGGYIPSHREFYAVQRVLRRNAKAQIEETQNS